MNIVAWHSIHMESADDAQPLLHIAVVHREICTVDGTRGQLFHYSERAVSLHLPDVSVSLSISGEALKVTSCTAWRATSMMRAWSSFHSKSTSAYMQHMYCAPYRITCKERHAKSLVNGIPCSHAIITDSAALDFLNNHSASEINAFLINR